MAQITPKIDVTIAVAEPVTELAQVISAVIAYHPGKQAEILRALNEAITKALDDAVVAADG